MTTTTTGAKFATAARAYLHIGPRTRSIRDGLKMRREVLDAINYAATLPGYHSAKTEAALRVAFAAANGYDKHIAGYRAAPRVVAKVQAMTPWQFVGMLAEMVDAGVDNAYGAERFFATL